MKLFAKIFAWIKNIPARIALIGQSIQFVAFFAHAGVGAFAVEHLPHRVVAGGILILAGAIKEFVFDAREEVNPPQTFMDNLQDFGGWLTGAVLGMMFGRG